MSTTEKYRQAMQDWRHDLHRHPELAFEERRTSEKVAVLLREFGLEVHADIGRTGVVGLLRRGNSDRAIGLRADMDALLIQERNEFDYRSIHDGKMHACGHDGHTAMLLGAARYLAEEGGFDGTAVFIFQPAEEHGAGARAMIDDGLFERFPVNAVYAIHNFPSIESGKFAVREGSIMAAEDNFEIRIRGFGHHAAMPHMGRDALLVGAEIVTAMQSLVARRVNPMDNAVVSFTEFVTDGTVNVVPGNVVLKGDTRSLTLEVQDLIEENMARIVAGICRAHGVEHDFSYRRNFVPTINTAAEAEIAARVAASVAGESRVIVDAGPVMTSEDFGFMLQARPGAYVLLGNGVDGVGGCSLHNPNYDFNDEILSIGADFWVALVESELRAG
ncbi:MAG TPA: M20 aminoacylase family protein [Gammaproteobacteria bacterium]|nr:M20 aminoacylase family protein [Gammaproteobacteria bacterium]